MSAAFVAGVFDFVDSGATTQAVTVTGVNAGDTIVVCSKAATPSSYTVDDDRSNSWSSIDSIVGGPVGSTVITQIANNVPSGDTVVTAHAPGGSGFPRLMAILCRGIDTSAPVNAHEIRSFDGNGLSSTDAITSAGSAVTTVDGCLILGFIVDHSGGAIDYGEGTGFTARTVGQTPSNNFDRIECESLVQSTHGAIHATWTSNLTSTRYLTTAMVALAPISTGVTGTMNVTEAPDAISGAGLIGGGVMTVTEPPDVFAGAGFSTVVGTAAITEAPDVFVGVAEGTEVIPLLVKIAPFFSTDTIVDAGYQLYRFVGGALVGDGSHHTAPSPIPNVTNGYAAMLTVNNLTLDSNGGYTGIIVWDNGGGSPFYVADEVYIPPDPWSSVVEDPLSALEVLRGIAAVLLGKASGMATTTAIFRDLADTKNRITATVDASGNRTSVTRNLT